LSTAGLEAEVDFFFAMLAVAPSNSARVARRRAAEVGG